MESVFKMNESLEKRESLKKDIETDVCIIGGGISGILTAYKLKEAGVGSVILEMERICSGVTGNTTAKITAHHGYSLTELIKRYGEDAIYEYVRKNLRAVDEYKKIVKEIDIDCDFKEQDNYLYAVSDIESLKEECRAARRMGLCAVLTGDVTLPFENKGAVRVAGQASFNPVKFLGEISRGLTVYEKTKVTSVKGETVFTDNATVKAKSIVFACHFPIVNFPGMYFVKMHQEMSYVLALETNYKLNGMYIGLEKDTLSLREYNGMILLGGGGHRTGKTKKESGYAFLEAAAHKYFPGCKEITRYATEDCMTAGGLPYVGPYSKKTPNHYVITGFGKWGMTNALASANIISDMITRKSSHKNSFFMPSAPKKNASAKIAVNTVQSAKGLITEYFTLPFSSVKDIKVGEGKIVMYNGKKTGVYRENKNTFHAVSTKCPHLGCQLSWNENEKTWDCPCHGSRFDFKGQLISNPSVKDIKLPDPFK